MDLKLHHTEVMLSIMVDRIILLGWLLTVLTWILFGIFFAVNKYVNYCPYQRYFIILS